MLPQDMLGLLIAERTEPEETRRAPRVITASTCIELQTCSSRKRVASSSFSRKKLSIPLAKGCRQCCVQMSKDWQQGRFFKGWIEQ